MNFNFMIPSAIPINKGYRCEHIYKQNIMSMKNNFPISSLGTYLRSKRESKRLTQDDLAKMLDLASAQYVSNCERDVVVPSTKILRRMFKALELDAEVVANFIAERTRRQLVKEFVALEQNRRPLLKSRLVRSVPRTKKPAI